jgi:hypothetical protein
MPATHRRSARLPIEALRGSIDRQQKERHRRHLIASFPSSLDEFDSLYRKLAR